MPVNVPGNGVKQEAVAAAPAATTEEKAVVPPAESNSVQPETQKENAVPYSRFKEVNDKMRSYENELAEVRKKLDAGSPDTRSNETVQGVSKDSYAKRLLDKGFDPRVAEAVAEVADLAAKDNIDRYNGQKLREQREEVDRFTKAKRDIDEWSAELEKAHPDHAKYQAQMEKEWAELDDEGRRAVVASKKAFSLFYKAAKAVSVDEVAANAEEAGRQDAYQTKSLKTALSSTPGSSPNVGKKVTAEGIANMSKAEYSALRKEIGLDGILKALGS